MRGVAETGSAHLPVDTYGETRLAQMTSRHKPGRTYGKEKEKTITSLETPFRKAKGYIHHICTDQTSANAQCFLVGNCSVLSVIYVNVLAA